MTPNQLNLEDHYDELVEAELQAMLRQAIDRPIDLEAFDTPTTPTLPGTTEAE